jgi:hypothetical protein
MCRSVSDGTANRRFFFESGFLELLWVHDKREAQSALAEPEVFVLSWPQGPSSPKSESTEHPLGLREMRSVSLGLPEPSSVSGALSEISRAGLLQIHRGDRPELVIRFTSNEDVQQSVPELGLLMVGRP